MPTTSHGARLRVSGAIGLVLVPLPHRLEMREPGKPATSVSVAA